MPTLPQHGLLTPECQIAVEGFHHQKWGGIKSSYSTPGIPGSKGGACSNSRPPPPLLQTPQSFRTPLSLRFWGKVLAPKAPIFFFCPPEGVFFLTYVSILKILRICGEFKKG